MGKNITVRTEIYCAITLRVVVTSYRRFGTCRSHFQWILDYSWRWDR